MYKPLPEVKCWICLEKYLVTAINMRFITKECTFCTRLKGSIQDKHIMTSSDI